MVRFFTTAPLCGSRAARPDSSRRRMASRTGITLVPTCSARSRTLSWVPAGSSPLMIAAWIVSNTRSVSRLGCATGVRAMPGECTHDEIPKPAIAVICDHIYTSPMAIVDRDELIELCRDALLRVGADAGAAHVLAAATVEAELVGNRAVGVAHLFDYLDGYAKGRIATDSRPVVRRPAPAVIDVDARDGLAQTAFVEVLDEVQK